MSIKTDIPLEHQATTKFKIKRDKLKGHSTKMEFFSEAGKKRLSRIWINENLSEELIFSGWMGRSDSLIREKVSDYMQSFLQDRFRRVSLNSKPDLWDFHFKESELSAAINKDYSKYKDFQDGLKRQKDLKRRQKEMSRIAKLTMTGKMEPLPENHKIKSNPEYKANRMYDRVKKLEKVKPKIKHDLSIANLPPIQSIHTQQKSKINLETNEAESVLLKYEKPIESRIFTSTPKSSISDNESISSGFQEITPSPNFTEQLEETKFEGKDVITITPDLPYTPQKQPDPDVSICSNISSDEFYCQMKDIDFYGVSDDLDLQMHFSWESSLVKQFYEENSAPRIYEIGTEVVGAYRRQMFVSRDFIQSLAKLIGR